MSRGEALLDGGARFAKPPGFFARLFAGGFHRILDRIDQGLEAGSLFAQLPDGTTRLLGGRQLGFEVQVDLKDWRALLRLATTGSVGWYQAWEAGEWDSPDPVPLFALFMANGEPLGRVGRSKGPWRLLGRIAHRINRNTRDGAQRNIHVHYDLGNDFYAAWLDATMSYSAALYDQGAKDLEAAQRRKWERLGERLGLPETLLEIGCGWGGLADHFARQGVAVTAISLSDEQLAWAREHQANSILFRKQDYRDVAGQFDAMVSVEMVEAVGREYWPAYLDCIARCLKPGGKAAVQFIAMKDSLFDAYAQSVDFIQAYIFPGGMLIRESEFRRLTDERGLTWNDPQDMGMDYAETLLEWRKRFDRAVEDGCLPAGFDHRFVQLWRYYLMYCEGGFRGRGITATQVTLTRG